MGKRPGSFHRAALMIDRNEGMTKTYNRFHDRNETADNIQRLRELHAAMDRAVLEAYGWHDLAARAAPDFGPRPSANASARAAASAFATPSFSSRLRSCSSAFSKA